MYAVDTNVLVYAHFDGYPQHHAARRFCRERLLGGEDWCLGWQVIYEYLRIVTHPRIHTRPLTTAEALADLQPYLDSPQCHVLTHGPRHHASLESLVSASPAVRGNLVHDCHYAVLLREHGIKTLYTADADFRQFPFLTVIDPTLA